MKPNEGYPKNRWILSAFNDHAALEVCLLGGCREGSHGTAIAVRWVQSLILGRERLVIILLIGGRNPKANHRLDWMVIKPNVNDGISTTNLNWCVCRISNEPSTVCHESLQLWFDCFWILKNPSCLQGNMKFTGTCDFIDVNQQGIPSLGKFWMVEWIHKKRINYCSLIL